MAREKVEIVTLDSNNIPKEDIVCVRGARHKEGITRKKDWLVERFKEGLQFKMLKVDDRSWGMIEYIPGEYAWRPVDARGYLFIHCLWVIGRQKGKGYGSLLVEQCLEDAKGTNGVAVITSKSPFLADKRIFLKEGFQVCDTAAPDYELLVKPLKKSSLPKFRDRAKNPRVENKNGITFVYSPQCPYVHGSLHWYTGVADKLNIPYEIIHVSEMEQAQNSASPHGTIGIFYNGRFLSHVLTTDTQFEKLVRSQINV